MYLLDTNVISEMRKPHTKINPSVKAWVSRQYKDQLYLSAISIYEIEVGIQRLARKDQLQAQHLKKWLHGILIPEMKNRILNLDLESALIAASYQVPDPRPSADCYIAAIAQRHQLKLVTRNVKDFQALGIEVINPWEI